MVSNSFMRMRLWRGTEGRGNERNEDVSGGVGTYLDMACGGLMVGFLLSFCDCISPRPM